jgi:hypothetical protein
VTDFLSLRTLNRTLLLRQHLLQRVDMPAAAMVEHLVGLQAQEPRDPYFALWTRVEGFQPTELASMLENRSAVRITLMRGTIHLVTARDCLKLRPVMQPVLDRVLNSGSPFGRRLSGIDMAALLAAGRELVETRPMSNATLKPLLAARWPDYDPESLVQAVRYLLPMVQVPPRGVWGRGGHAVHTTAEHWLGRQLDDESAPDAVVLRYLAAFGPASAADIRAWANFAALQPVIERLRPRLRTYRDEQGRELFDLPDAPIAEPDLPAPPRFMPEYDNVFLSHADRGRIVSEAYRKRFMAGAVGRWPFFVDGFGAGSWRLQQNRDGTTLLIEPFGAVETAQRQALAEEGERLLDFAAPEATSREIRFV